MSIPDYLGKYQIISLLGRGSMGMVYQAKDPDINQLVAIKTIRREFLVGSGDNEVLQRFKNEVIASRRLKHSNIVATYEYNENDNKEGPFIVMEYVAGKLLGDVIKAAGELAVGDVFEYMQQILSALAYAHDNGVVHRDIKPANILINESNQVQIMDFGIAKLESSELTMVGSVLGTPSYMSPEQCMGQEADARSDLFSAAIVFYQMLTGEKPFVGETQMITMNQIVNTLPVMPSVLQPSYSPEVDRVVSKALAKDAKDRYQTAQAFAEDLLLIKASTVQAKGNAISNDATLIMQTNVNSAPKTKWVKGLSLVLLLAGIAAAAWFAYQRVDEDKKEVLIPSAPVLVVVENERKLEPTVNDVDEEPPEPEPVVLDVEEQPPTAEPEMVPANPHAINLIYRQLDLFHQQFPCSSMEVDPTSKTQFNVLGYIPSDTVEILQSALSSVAGAEIILDLKQIKAHCDVVRSIWPFYQSGQKLQIALVPDNHKLKEGSSLRLRITIPETPVYLNVDYVQADGNIAHLVDNRYLEPATSGSTLELGNNNEWLVTAPFGVDMVIVTVSENAVFSFAREPIEDRSTYLNAWQGIAQQGVMTDFLYIETFK
ncbi:MAG: protein kinase [Methyloprofundus sp.]|nr:protein kinase [Methyloprofundus sp.]